MPRVWGSWSATSSTGARYRVGFDYSRSGTRVTVDKFVFESAYSIHKNVTLRRTGRLSGSYSVRVSTSGGVVSLGRGGSVTGSRGGSVTIGGRVTNILHGLTCSVSRKIDIPALAPSKPSAPSVSNISDTSARLSWSAPASNGASITQYQWQVRDSSNTIVQSGTTSSRSATTTGRVGNRSYRVRVRARNSAGWSSWSNYRSFTMKVGTPAAPSNASATRQSDTRIRVSWTRNATSSAPYTSQQVQRRRWGLDPQWTSWTTIATVSSTATSYIDNGVRDNRSYQYRLRARNAAGTSGTSASTSSVRTTPRPPADVVAKKLSGGDIRVEFRQVAPFTSDVEHQLQDNPGGSGWVTVATRSGSGSFTHVDPDPSVTHRYRVRTRETRSGLTSAWSSVSNTVQLLAPPSAPTRLAPSGTLDRDEDVTFQWRHNSVDTTDQAEYQLRYRVDNGSWTTLTGTTNETRTVTALGVSGTFEWRVRTRGEHPDWSPWSSVGSFRLATRPTLAINSPEDGVHDTSSVELVVGYDQAENVPQQRVEAELVTDGVVVETLTWTGTGDTRSFETSLDDATEYTVRARARSGDGLWSDWDETTFTTDFPQPLPYRPIAEWDRTTGAVLLTAEPEQIPGGYTWEGTPNDSPTIFEGLNTEYRNEFPNPRLVTTDGTVVLWENLVSGTKWALEENQNKWGSWWGSWRAASEYVLYLAPDLETTRRLTQTFTAPEDGYYAARLEARGQWGYDYTKSHEEWQTPASVELQYPDESDSVTGHFDGMQWASLSTEPVFVEQGETLTFEIRAKTFHMGRVEVRYPILMRVHELDAELSIPFFDDEYQPAVVPGMRLETGPTGGARWVGDKIKHLEVEGGVAISDGSPTGGVLVDTSDGGTVVTTPGLEAHARGVAMLDGSPLGFDPSEGFPGPSGLGAVSRIDSLMVTDDPNVERPFSGDDKSDLLFPDFISYQRRDSSDGRWVTLATELDPEESITDYTPRLVAPEYRIISHTTLPSSSTGETVVVEWEHKRDPIFVNSGPDYSLVCSAMGGEATDEPEIEQSSTVFEGVPMPVAIFGDTEHHEVTFSGIIHPLLVTEEGVSTREEWLELLRERQVVCYRDCQGRKIYGLLNLSFSQDRLVETINLSVAQVWHEEGVRQ